MNPTHVVITNVKDKSGKVRVREGTQVELVGCDDVPAGMAKIRIDFSFFSITRFVRKECLARLQ